MKNLKLIALLMLFFTSTFAQYTITVVPDGNLAEQVTITGTWFSGLQFDTVKYCHSVSISAVTDGYDSINYSVVGHPGYVDLDSINVTPM